jgi:DNA-directed RNA polymerase specialized sigma24 family protein
MTEHDILRKRAAGEVSVDDSFEALYELYGRQVRGWLTVRAGAADADDLAQDVWTVFYRRWKSWQFVPELEAQEARPVISFLFRTCHFVLAGHLRVREKHGADTLGSADAVPVSPDPWLRQLELKRCLSAVRASCSAGDLAIVTGKLSGVSGREIARTLGMTEAAVDHAYRRVIATLRARLQPRSAQE